MYCPLKCPLPRKLGGRGAKLEDLLNTRFTETGSSSCSGSVMMLFTAREVGAYLVKRESIFSAMSLTKAARGVPALRSLEYSVFTILISLGFILLNHSRAM